MRKFVAFLAVVAIAACDTRIGSSFVAPVTPSITGRYVVQTVSGVAPPVVTSQTGTATTTLLADTLTFNSDGKTVTHTFVISIAAPPGSLAVQQPAITETGTFVLSNSALILVFPNGSGGSDAFSGTQSGTTVTIIDGNNTFVYKKI